MPSNKAILSTVQNNRKALYRLILFLSLPSTAVFCATRWATSRTISFFSWKWHWPMDASRAPHFWTTSCPNLAYETGSSFSSSRYPCSPARQYSRFCSSSRSRKPGTKICFSCSAPAISVIMCIRSWTTRSSPWDRTKSHSPCFSPTSTSTLAVLSPGYSEAIREQAAFKGSSLLADLLASLLIGMLPIVGFTSRTSLFLCKLFLFNFSPSFEKKFRKTACQTKT